jgi:hypothetical protein
MASDMGEKIEKLRQEYTLDTAELGKIMLISSITLFIISVHSTLTLQESSKQADQLHNSLEKTDAIINSQDFNDSLDALEDTQGTQIAPRFIKAAEAFRNAQNTTQTADEMRKDLENTTKVYQWTTLISILGAVAGAVILYS